MAEKKHEKKQEGGFSASSRLSPSLRAKLEEVAAILREESAKKESSK